jgi:hypothetical protein
MRTRSGSFGAQLASVRKASRSSCLRQPPTVFCSMRSIRETVAHGACAHLGGSSSYEPESHARGQLHFDRPQYSPVARSSIISVTGRLPRRCGTPLWRRIASRVSGRIDQGRMGRHDSGKAVDSFWSGPMQRLGASRRLHEDPSRTSGSIQNNPGLPQGLAGRPCGRMRCGVSSLAALIAQGRKSPAARSAIFREPAAAHAPPAATPPRRLQW